MKFVVCLLDEANTSKPSKYVSLIFNVHTLHALQPHTVKEPAAEFHADLQHVWDHALLYQVFLTHFEAYGTKVCISALVITPDIGCAGRQGTAAAGVGQGPLQRACLAHPGADGRGDGGPPTGCALLHRGHTQHRSPLPAVGPPPPPSPSPFIMRCGRRLGLMQSHLVF